MTTAASKAFNSSLLRGATEIEEVTNLTCPSSESAEINVTSHDSTVAEFLAGLITNGTFDVTMLYSAATGQETLRGDLGGAATTYTINCGTGTGKPKLTMSCIVTKWQLGSLGMNDAITANATLRVTGAITPGTQS